MKKLLALATAALLAAGLTACTVDEAPEPTTPVAEQPAGDSAEAKPERKTEKPAEPKVSLEEQQAVIVAEEYLAYSGFSRDGLVQQLSSEYGEGFPKKVAEKAVDSLDVDWKSEAVESASSYMEMGGFSRDGLIEQLSSEYGEGFTREQAEHAATAVGY